LSTTYNTIQGDTYDAVSRKVYGVEVYADLLEKSNPGRPGPFAAGEVLNVPPVTPGYVPQDATPQRVSITIGGRTVTVFTQIEVERAFDKIDTFSLVAPLTPDDPLFREIFRPLSFQRAVVGLEGAPVLVGTLVNVTPATSAGGRTVALTGYALPGVLSDCMTPASAYPVEFNDLSLQGIADTLCAPFGIQPRFVDDPGADFTRVEPRTDEPVLGFLVRLAAMRGGVWGSGEDGALEFRKSKAAGVPVAELAEGQPPLMSVDPVFDPQAYFSEVTAVAPVDIGAEGGRQTVKNPFVPGSIRPFTFKVQNADNVDVMDVAQAKIGRMFGNAATYVAEVSTWLDKNGDAWAPGSFVSLQAPGALVYEPYVFEVRAVKLRLGGDGETAILSLVIPGAFDGKVPEVLPWD